MILKYVVRRLVQSIPLVFGAVVITFLLIHTAPGDPIVALAGEDGNAEYYDMMRTKFRLDRPVWERLAVYVGQFIQGDLGYSYRYNQPALAVVLDRLPSTLLLMIPSLIFAVVIGITFGIIAANYAHSLTDFGVTVLSLLGNTVPVFWLAQILLLIFAFQLDLFPIQGMFNLRQQYEGWRYYLDVMHHMALPVFALTVQYMAPISRITRTSMLESLNQTYIQTARSKGFSEPRVLIRHALPNAMLAIVTVIGSQIGFMLAGAVVTETVFAWPGLGRLLLSAMLNRDFAIVMAMFLILSVAVVIANLITDIVYFYLDPRIRHE